MPDQSHAPHGKHKELAQVSNLTQPISSCDPLKTFLGAASRSYLVCISPRNITVPLSLPLFLPSDCDTPPPASRVLLHPESLPMSIPPEHDAWSFCSGFFCHVRHTNETKAQRGKRTFFYIIRTKTEQTNKITKRTVKLILVQTGN